MDTSDGETVTISSPTVEVLKVNKTVNSVDRRLFLELTAANLNIRLLRQNSSGPRVLRKLTTVVKTIFKCFLENRAKSTKIDLLVIFLPIRPIEVQIRIFNRRLFQTQVNFSFDTLLRIVTDVREYPSIVNSLKSIKNMVSSECNGANGFTKP